MGKGQDLDSAIQDILRTTEQRALSASQITDRLNNEYSRQYIDRTLRRLSGRGTIGRVELGPSVGYYIVEDPIQRIREHLEGIGVDRAGWSLGIPCIQCGEFVADGESIDLLFEWLPDHWTVEAGLCSDCRDGSTTAIQLCSAKFLGQARQHGSNYVTVRGLLEEQDTKLEGREVSHHAITNVQILEILPSSEDSDTTRLVGDEYNSSPQPRQDV